MQNAESRTKELTPLFFNEAPDLRRWVDAFVVSKQADGVSALTVKSYSYNLGLFLAWADARAVTTPEEVTADILRQYVVILSDRLTPGGARLAYQVLKVFLNWWEAEAEPPAWRNPCRRVKAPKPPAEPLEPADIADIAKMAKSANGGRWTERDRAILLALVDTGLRASELCALDVGDVDAVTGAVTVRQGKGGKARVVFLGATARRALRAWLKVRSGPGPALFTSEGSPRLAYKGLWQVIRRAAERAGVKRPPLHAFRRAFAINALRNGCDLLTLARLLGHSDLSLLKRYAKQTTDDLRQVHAAVSPVDRAGL